MVDEKSIAWKWEWAYAVYHCSGLNCVHPKDTSKSQPSYLQMWLIWKQGFCRYHEGSQDKIILNLGWALIQWLVPLQEKDEGNLRHTRGEGHIRIEAEIRVMQPQAKKCQEPPEAGKSKRCPARACQGAWPCWDLDFRLLWCLRWWRVCLQWRRPRFDPWVCKIPWRR